MGGAFKSRVGHQQMDQGVLDHVLCIGAIAQIGVGGSEDGVAVVLQYQLRITVEQDLLLRLLIGGREEGQEKRLSPPKESCGPGKSDPSASYQINSPPTCFLKGIQLWDEKCCKKVRHFCNIFCRPGVYQTEISRRGGGK